MSLEKIAKLSGVSRSTVSRVVNHDPHVNEATREHVLEIIRQTGYHPNAVARSLAAGHSRVLGLVIPMGVSTLFTDPYYPIIIQGISAACNAHDYSIMLWLADPEYEHRTIRQVIHSRMVDGVIVVLMLVADRLVQSLLESDLPFVLNGRYMADANVSYVAVDNVSSTREMVAHLLRHGYRRVATIAGPKNIVSGVDRREGYQAALRDRGLPIDPNLIVEGDFTEMGGYIAMQRLLPHHPEAVFAASDAMAVGAMRAIQAHGLRVPEDIAVAGFDDMPFSANANPPLTTVRQPIHRAGVVAVETLLDLIEHPETGSRRVLLPTEMVIRSSCGTELNLNKPVSEQPAPPA